MKKEIWILEYRDSGFWKNWNEYWYKSEKEALKESKARSTLRYPFRIRKYIRALKATP
jgi:hypothetical protein